MTGKILKIGCVGAGYIAELSHLPILSKLSEAKVVAICDTDKERLQKIASQFKIPRHYTELDDMLDSEELDLVDICTPPHTHGDLIVKVLNKGCHCLTEKPFTTTVAQADQAIKLATEKGLGLYVIHNYSYVPCIRKVRSMVHAGSIGKLVNIDIKYLTSIERERDFATSHWAHHLPGGILNSEKTPHLIMLILEFLDDNVEYVKAATEKISGYPHIVADELRVMLKAGNSLGCLSLSYNAPRTSFSIDLVGTKGRLYIDGNSQAIIRYKPSSSSTVEEECQNVLARGMTALGEIGQRITGLASTAVKVILGRYIPLHEGHRFLIKECLRDLRGQGHYPVDIWKCREVVRILEEVFSSLK